MRILLVTHYFPPNHIGGTETLTLALAKNLQERGHAVQVICAEDFDRAPSHKITATDDVHRGIPVRRLHFNWALAPDVFGSLYNNPEVETYFHTYLAHYQPDIVHITSCYTLSASVINAVKQTGIPMILTATDFWFLCSRNTLLQSDGTLCTGPENAWKCAKCKLADAKVYRWPNAVLPESIVAKLLLSIGKIPAITRQRGLRGMHGDWDHRHEFLMAALDKVDQIVTASHLVESYFIQYGVPSEKIVFSRYGFDTSWAKRHQEKTPSEALRLGFIGNILSIKGPDLLLKAVKALDSDLPLELKIYGNLEKVPEYGQRLRDIAGNDARISFEGTFPYHDIGKVLENIDVLVVPSIWYDFPLIIPSALATKTPVIATDMPGMNELIRHEVDGLLFARHDVPDLTHQINRLFAEPELLQTLRSGIQPVKTVETMTEEYLARYQALLEAESPVMAQVR